MHNGSRQATRSMEKRTSRWGFAGTSMDGICHRRRWTDGRRGDARIEEEVRSGHLEEMRLHGRIRNGRSGTGMECNGEQPGEGGTRSGWGTWPSAQQWLRRRCTCNTGEGRSSTPAYLSRRLFCKQLRCGEGSVLAPMTRRSLNRTEIPASTSPLLQLARSLHPALRF
jgi:hypothetical protein